MARTDGFGSRLRTARRQAGMSQSDLQHASGVPKSRLSRYENGHLLPSLTTLQRIAAALRISASGLLDPMHGHMDAFIDELQRRGVGFGSEDEARSAAQLAARAIQGMPAIEEAG